MVKEIAETIRDKHPGKSLSGMGGIESGTDAAQFILLGADTVQVCTGVMKHGYDMVKRMKDELLAFMSKHKFEKLSDFKGHSLQYFTTHADLVRRQAEAKALAEAKARGVVVKDTDWQGDTFVKQSNDLARN
jgi:dihydropyrimidine dehydrogenase (NADP+)/dihydropyrimidine dehydrogenase (NAD+) subunit PreA